MTTAPNPYAADLGAREPLDAFAATPFAIEQLVSGWSDADFERTYAPGKWTARQLLIHLAQTELALGTRARYALTPEGYAAQSFSQDEWMVLDAGMDARTALGVYTAVRRMNVPMFRRLSPSQLQRTFTHPEYGTLTAEWVLRQMAGHDIHHLVHFETIART